MSKLSIIKDQILTLQGEIEDINKKQERLKALQADYYREFFQTKRDYFTKLKEIPERPEGTPNILEPYGILAVDTVGYAIRDLIRKIDHEEVVAKRDTHVILDENGEQVEEPIFIIGRRENMIYQAAHDKNIVIEYDPSCTLDKYPSRYPVSRVFLSEPRIEEYSNYRNMFGDIKGLAFDPKGREYIYELICNLAYLQYQFQINQMSQDCTWKSYERIYRTRNRYDTK